MKRLTKLELEAVGKLVNGYLEQSLDVLAGALPLDAVQGLKKKVEGEKLLRELGPDGLQRRYRENFAAMKNYSQLKVAEMVTGLARITPPSDGRKLRRFNRVLPFFADWARWQRAREPLFTVKEVTPENLLDTMEYLTETASKNARPRTLPPYWARRKKSRATGSRSRSRSGSRPATPKKRRMRRARPATPATDNPNT